MTMQSAVLQQRPATRPAAALPVAPPPPPGRRNFCAQPAALQLSYPAPASQRAASNASWQRRTSVRPAAAAGAALGAAHHAQATLLGHSTWGIWAALAAAGCAGLWCEQTKWGKEMSGALLSTLFGLALSNLGVVPAEAPHVYGVVNSYLLPLAVPLLLFSADLRRVLRETGRLLGAFTWGALGTVIGSLLAFWLMPLRSLGADGWKVAAALTARHIGGSVNYVAVSEALELSPSARMAGLAADDLIVSAYFVSLYAMAKKVPPENASAAPVAGGGGELQPAPAVVAGAAGIAAAAPAAPQAWRAQPQAAGPAPPADPAAAQQAAAADQAGSSQGGGHGGGGDGRTITVLHGATALALASAICFVGTQVAAAMRYKGGSITVITAITVTLATLFPRLLAPLRASGEGLAAILMQLFFASVGASGSIATVMKTAPSLFLWSAVAVSTHLGVVLVGERLLGFSRKESCLASNANIGGPTTAAGMAAAKGWRSSLVPALLIGIMGYATATFVGVACAAVFQRMQGLG